jgi:hypothetical protein
MVKAIDVLRAWVELGASQEDMQSGNYADRVINSYNNCELLEAMDDASVWEQSLDDDELRERGLA